MLPPRYYTRLAFYIQYSLYKNVACFIVQFFFAFYSNWSAMTLYETLFLNLYNNVFTLVPVLVYGITERSVSAKRLLNNPALYKRNAGNRPMAWHQLLRWLI